MLCSDLYASTDDPKKKDQKSFDPQWAKEYQTISDFFLRGAE